ncbi:hypothetical protein ACE6H2_014475 [Prunus campanulata]
MVEWVWELYGEDRVNEAADPKLCGDFDKKQMRCLMIVGLWCAHPDYNMRPSIQQAIQVLNFEVPLPNLPSKMPVATYFAPRNRSQCCLEIYHSFSIMNKGWVFLNRRSDDYMSGLQDFIGHSLSVAAFEGNIKCPCRYCCNRFWKQPGVVLDHILYDGMDPIYANKPWTAHGESLTRPATEIPNATYGDMPAMLHDAFGVHGFDNLPDTNDGLESHQEPTHDAKNFYRLVEEGEIELYPGCGKSKLSFLVGLYQIKCLSGWSDTSIKSSV